MIKYSFLLLFSVFFFNTYAQENTGVKNERHVYLYSFENLSSQEQVDNLISDVKKISFISEAKVNCKWEKSGGELIFVYIETISGSEDVDNPDFSQIKHLIQKNGLMPVEFKERLSR